MKKRLIIFISAICTAIFAISGFGCTCAGCNNVVAPDFNQYWFDNAASTKESVTETAVYGVSYLSDYEGAKATNSYIVPNLSGTYTATFTTSGKDDLKKDAGDELYTTLTANYSGDVYAYKTELKMRGTYTVKGVADPVQVDDSVVSRVYFKDINGAFYPMLSVKQIVSTSPTSQTSVSKFAYSLKTAYVGSTAEVTITADDEQTVIYFRDLKLIGKDANSNTTKIKKTSGYFDNEQLLFLIRGFQLAKDFTQTMYILEPTAAAKKSTVVKVTTEPESVTSKLAATDGTEGFRNITCLKTIISLNDSTYSGQSKTAYFAAYKTAENATYYREYHNLLVKMYDPMPFKTGALCYTLSSYTRNGQIK